MPPKAASTYPCDKCEKTFPTKKELILHQYIHKEKPNTTCSECNRTFPNEFAFKRHQRTHDAKEKRKKSCQICGESFYSGPDLEKHHREKHLGDKRFVCQKCGAEFSWYENLRKHMRMHNNYVCDICHKAFDDTTSLRIHIRSTHEKKPESDKPYTCKVCHKSFKYDFSFKAHMNSHLLPIPGTSAAPPPTNDKQKWVKIIKPPVQVMGSNRKPIILKPGQMQLLQLLKASKNGAISIKPTTAKPESTPPPMSTINTQMLKSLSAVNSSPEEDSEKVTTLVIGPAVTPPAPSNDPPAKEKEPTNPKEVESVKTPPAQADTQAVEKPSDVPEDCNKAEEESEDSESLDDTDSSEDSDSDSDSCSTSSGSSSASDTSDDEDDEDEEDEEDEDKKEEEVNTNESGKEPPPLIKENTPEKPCRETSPPKLTLARPSGRFKREPRKSRKKRNFIPLKYNFVMTEEKPFKCDICRKSFRWEISLKIHQETHSATGAEKPFECCVCHKKYRWQVSHKLHMKTHSQAQIQGARKLKKVGSKLNSGSQTTEAGTSASDAPPTTELHQDAQVQMSPQVPRITTAEKETQTSDIEESSVETEPTQVNMNVATQTGSEGDSKAKDAHFRSSRIVQPNASDEEDLHETLSSPEVSPKPGSNKGEDRLKMRLKKGRGQNYKLIGGSKSEATPPKRPRRSSPRQGK